MNIYDDDFSTADVLSAVDIAEAKLQSWLRRGLIVGQREGKIVGSQGRARRFSFHSVMEIAVAAALIDTGVPVDTAFQVTRKVAYVGASDRVAGLPWPRSQGETLLAVSGDKTRLIRTIEGADVFLHFADAGQAKPDRVNVVDVSAIFDRVSAKIYEDGNAPNSILEAEYPEAGTK